jgi:hypothetical protein
LNPGEITYVMAVRALALALGRQVVMEKTG